MIRTKLKYIWLLLALTAFNVGAQAQEAGTAATKKAVDVQSIVFGHINDSHEWHITTWAGKSISIPLPIIIHSASTGWHCFSSSHLYEGNGVYKGFYIATQGDNKDKICEKNAKGAEVRVLDISITKDVLQLWIVLATMLLVFLGCARWYKGKKPSDDAPKGFVGFVEWAVMAINDDLIKNSIGEKHYRKYAPFLLMAFFFIFLCNVFGLIPIFPGGANLTGNIAITFFLALCTMIAVNLFGNKAYWKDIFWPDVPIWLKCPVPMMPVIEFFGVFTKPFALMVRLFANILAGHAIVLSLVCIIFVTWQIGAVMGTSLTIVSVVMTIFMDFLELLVAFIQAYVFTMLSAVFIGLAHLEPEKKQ